MPWRRVISTGSALSSEKIVIHMELIAIDFLAICKSFRNPETRGVVAQNLSEQTLNVM